MPGLNKMGPQDLGPMTGRKLGNCNSKNNVSGDDANNSLRRRGFRNEQKGCRRHRRGRHHINKKSFNI